MTGTEATRVHFYVLGAPDVRARLVTACRLAEKACNKGLRVAVRAASPSQAAEFDELLWTFSDRSFVPHGVWPSEAEFAAATPVLIASGALPESHRDVLINLGDDLPPDAVRYARVCEVVAGDDASKHCARARWRGYKDAGLKPETHKL